MNSTSHPHASFDWIALRSACQHEPHPRRREKMERFLDALENMDAQGRVRACEEARLSRPTFNRWHSEFLAGGADADTLRALAAGKPHAHKTAPLVVARVIELGKEEQPGFSGPAPDYQEIAEIVSREFKDSSYAVPGLTTVRNILRANGLLPVQQPKDKARLCDKDLLWCREQTTESVRSHTPPFVPSGEQLGRQLVQSFFCVRVDVPLQQETGRRGAVSGPASVGEATPLDEPVAGTSLYVHAVMDPQSRFVWAVLHSQKIEGAPLALLRDVCAFYASRKRKPAIVKTAWRAEFCPMRGGWNRNQDRHVA